jgi:hypothetical protein
MIGTIDGDRNDTTPRKDGKFGGAPWTAIGTGTEDVQIGPAIPCPAAPSGQALTLRISYEVRGRCGTNPPILVVGQANVTVSDEADPVITEDVRTFTNARVTLYADVATPAIIIQAEQDVSDDWEFRVIVAHDVLVPVVA